MAGADIFDQIATGRGTQRGAFIKEGRGLLVVEGLYVKDLKNSGPTFIAELRTVKAEPSGITDPRTGKVPDPNAPGEKVSLLAKLTGSQEERQIANGKIHGFMCALWGKDENAIPDSEFAAQLKASVDTDTFDSGQPARGMLIGFETYRQQTRKHKAAKSLDFNVYPNWKAIDTQTPEGLARRAAVIDAGEVVKESDLEPVPVAA